MSIRIPYIYESLFIDVVLPYTVILIWIFVLCVIVTYIVHKMKNNGRNISFKVTLKTLSKLGISIYLIPIVMIALLVPIYPQEIYHSKNVLIYEKLNSIDFDGLILNHMHIFGITLSFFMSLVLLAYGFQQKNIERLSKMQLVLYLIIVTPIIYGLLLLSSKVSLLLVIVIIGLPGALLAYLK